MSITKRLLEMMDSTLHVESVYGEGSVFSFCLSQEVVSWERLGDYEKSYRASLSQRRKAHASFFAPDAIVLVVDDNPMNLLVFKSLLKWTKVQVDMAESGDEGISLSLEKKYDLIFMDHMMPIKDGVEALHELRSQGNSPNLETPVICLTANAVSGAREQYIQAGFDDYLTKPIDSSKLEEMICYYLPEEKIKEAKEEEDPVHENGSEGEKPGTLQGCESGEIIDARPGHPAQAQSLEGGPERKGELSQEGEEENPDILKPLRGQDWIDLSLGIENSGSLEVYLSLLKIFYESLESKGEEIEKNWEEENWRDYTIQVHALKSSARLIGAMAFGEKAQLLENAGKEEDLDYIRANHREFMKEYEGFKKPLSQMFPASSQEGELLEPDPDRLRSSYERVRLAAEEMDIEELDKIISEMKKYRIPESEKTLWHQLEEAVSHYDYDRITEIMSEV